MKHTRIEQVPATTREVTDKITCDFCGHAISGRSYNVDEVRLEYQTGYSYPDCSEITTQYVDCCSTCWENKILVMFKQHNVEPSVTTYER